MAARPLSLPRLRPVRVALPALPGLRRLLVVAAAAVLLVVGWMWLRDSSLVAVRQVDVLGARGTQNAGIRAAIENAATDMTTLHVRPDALRKAVAPYPIVKDVVAKADFPHRLRVTVVQYTPVGVIVVAGNRVPVAPDGKLLRGSVATGVPVIPLAHPPSGDRVTDPAARGAVAVLADAPAALRRRVAKVFLGPRGLTARMTTGTALYFGSGERMKAKWAAATAVLADPSSRGATSIDLRVPERPAAGGLEQIATQEPAAPATATTQGAPLTP